MKLLKTYITLALLNISCMVLIIGGGSAIKQYTSSSLPQQQEVNTTIAPMAAVSAVPTPQPQKKRIVRVVRKSPTLTPGAVADSPSVHANQQQVDTGMSADVSARTSTPQPAPQDSRCLITIDGAMYDVTAFRSMHSGGNIFTCAADMSAVFWSQHGASTLNQMAKYKI